MPLSVAERCKRFREKKKLTDPNFNETEAERKRNRVIMLKIKNPEKNQERLKQPGAICS